MTGSVKHQIGDSQLTIGFLGHYTLREMERPRMGATMTAAEAYAARFDAVNAQR